ncbi:MAG: radical SAM protein [Christensenellaceae bacterium]|nr:radical SAM protein [Christensenellaceae bacterium]MCI7769226.1 radical SAM protein [Christensenellaceae bacterium]
MLCNLCPNGCNADRSKTTGFCLADDNVRVSYHGLHEWEEPCISGPHGSGAIFFSGCTMRCVFCQNAKISRKADGKALTAKELAGLFALYDEKADNINLVSGTQYADKIIEAFKIYRPEKPVIWNTSGYETLPVIRALSPCVSVWLPDLKYVDSALSKRLSGKSDYFKYAFEAISLMTELQSKVVFSNGLIKKGVIVRHLIIPSHIQNTLDVVKVFSENFKDKALFSLMAQYVPCGVENFKDIDRKITALEYKRALNALDEYGITNGYIQELSSADTDFIPGF